MLAGLLNQAGSMITFQGERLIPAVMPSAETIHSRSDQEIFWKVMVHYFDGMAKNVSTYDSTPQNLQSQDKEGSEKASVETGTHRNSISPQALGASLEDASYFRPKEVG